MSFPWTPHGLNAERTCVSAARTCHGGLLRSVAPSFIFCYASERVMRHRRSSSKLAPTRVFAHLDHAINATSCLEWGQGTTVWKKCIIVVSHLFWFVVHVEDTGGTLYTRNMFFNIFLVSNVKSTFVIPASAKCPRLDRRPYQRIGERGRRHWCSWRNQLTIFEAPLHKIYQSSRHVSPTKWHNPHETIMML